MDSIIDVNRQRRSIRDFSQGEVSHEEIMFLMEAARWAPSGKNGQPWRFVVIHENHALKERFSRCTVNLNWVSKADCLILAFQYVERSYDRQKDTLAMGAAIQNILLAAHARGLGACWLGEIVAQEASIREMVPVPATCEMLAVIAIGHVIDGNRAGNRRETSEFVTVV